VSDLCRLPRLPVAALPGPSRCPDCDRGRHRAQQRSRTWSLLCSSPVPSRWSRRSPSWWPSAFHGGVEVRTPGHRRALLVLAALVAALGPALVPSHRSLAGLIGACSSCRTAVAAQGGAASGGLKAKHARTPSSRAHQPARGGGKNEQRVGFVMAFKACSRGLEVVIIVLTLGATSGKGRSCRAGGRCRTGGGRHRRCAGGPSALRRPRERHEAGRGTDARQLRTFWSGEGLHVSWPGSDLAIVALVASTAQRRGRDNRPSSAPGPRRRRRSSMPESASPESVSLARRALVGFGRFLVGLPHRRTPSCSWRGRGASSPSACSPHRTPQHRGRHPPARGRHRPARGTLRRAARR